MNWKSAIHSSRVKTQQRVHDATYSVLEVSAYGDNQLINVEVLAYRRVDVGQGQIGNLGVHTLRYREIPSETNILKEGRC